MFLGQLDQCGTALGPRDAPRQIRKSLLLGNDDISSREPKLREAELLTKAVLGILIDMIYPVTTLEIYP